MDNNNRAFGAWSEMKSSIRQVSKNTSNIYIFTNDFLAPLKVTLFLT